MAARWVPAQDLFDQWSSEEDELAFARAGGHAYNFAMMPPAPRVELDPEDDALDGQALVDEGPDDQELEDEFAREDALLDAQDTMTLRVMSAETTGILAAIDDETTGTLAAFG